MQDDTVNLFAVGSAGPVSLNPLAKWKLRFDPRTGIWSRAELRKVGMPRRISREAVAEEVGVTPEIIKAWEDSVRAAANPDREQDPAELLRVGPNGPIHHDPLLKWRFKFYPDSGRWRRATASRGEVTREEVLKKVGVSPEILEAWELATMKSENAKK